MNSAQLKARGNELREALKGINEGEGTDAEKGAALDKLQAEFDTHALAVKNSERSADMHRRLGPVDQAEVEGESSILPTLEVRGLSQVRRELGAALLKHPKYLAAVAKTAQKGGVPREEFNYQFELDLKDATAGANLMGEGLTGATGPTAAGNNPFLPGGFGPAILPTFLPGMVQQLFYQLHVADLISSIPVTGPDLSYLTESVAVNNAAATAEDGLYPFSSEQFARVYEQVGKITNAATLTDEVISDAPQLFSFVQGRLLEGIQRQEEVQILAGSGYPGVNGLLNRSANFVKPQSIAAATNVKFPADNTNGAFVTQQTVASLTYGRKIVGATGAVPSGAGVYPTAVEIAEGIFAALVDIQLSVFSTPNAIVMNPLDWAIIRIAKDVNGQYFGGSFFGQDYGNGGNAPQSLWGTRVVTSLSIPQGTVLVGYFDGSTIQTARREGVSLSMTNANGTDFVNGRITVRAEERLGLLVYRPSAFELIQLVAGPAGAAS